MTILTDSAGNTYVNNLIDVVSWNDFKNDIITAVTQVYGTSSCVYFNPSDPNHFKFEFTPGSSGSGANVDQAAPPYNTTTNLLRGGCGGYPFSWSDNGFWVNRALHQNATSFGYPANNITATTNHQYYAVLNTYSAIFVTRGEENYGAANIVYFGMPRQNIALPTGLQASPPYNYQVARFAGTNLIAGNYAGGKIFWLDNLRSFDVSRLNYSISCADQQTPSSSGWTSDIYFQVQNPANTSNYPSPGALHNILFGTDSGFSLNSVYTVDIGDDGSTNWLCALKSNYNGTVKSILLRLPPSGF